MAYMLNVCGGKKGLKVLGMVKESMLAYAKYGLMGKGSISHIQHNVRTSDSRQSCLWSAEQGDKNHKAHT